jgi:hypothetical protein
LAPGRPGRAEPAGLGRSGRAAAAVTDLQLPRGGADVDHRRRRRRRRLDFAAAAAPGDGDQLVEGGEVGGGVGELGAEGGHLTEGLREAASVGWVVVRAHARMCARVYVLVHARACVQCNENTLPVVGPSQPRLRPLRPILHLRPPPALLHEQLHLLQTQAVPTDADARRRRHELPRRGRLPLRTGALAPRALLLAPRDLALCISEPRPSMLYVGSGVGAADLLIAPGVVGCGQGFLSLSELPLPCCQAITGSRPLASLLGLFFGIGSFLLPNSMLVGVVCSMIVRCMSVVRQYSAQSTTFCTTGRYVWLYASIQLGCK